MMYFLPPFPPTSYPLLSTPYYYTLPYNTLTLTQLTFSIFWPNLT